MAIKKISSLLVLLAGLFLYPLQAQVTIGLDEKAVTGALLQIKDQVVTGGAVNAKGGLAMPRVNLTNLKPATDAQLAASMGVIGSYSMSDHVGLTIYNVNSCLHNNQGLSLGAGIYTWDGTQWQASGMSALAVYNIRIASPAETSGANIWGSSVILHQAKTGVYEQFTSADFGVAGRWMTTNLSATAYDGIVHSQGRTLTGPNGNSDNAYNTAYWCYPNANGGDPLQSTEYDKNKSLGYLYTWDAATAGKGGVSGNEFPINEEGLNHANPQGICPKGWHLPSDYEWTQLEDVFTASKSLYSYISSSGNGKNGTAMKDMCETSSGLDPAGASRPASQGGFAVLMSGAAVSGSTGDFGNSAYFWSSSFGGRFQAWYRNLYSFRSSVGQSILNRFYFVPVRCKKDD